MADKPDYCFTLSEITSIHLYEPTQEIILEFKNIDLESVLIAIPVGQSALVVQAMSHWTTQAALDMIHRISPAGIKMFAKSNGA